MKSNFLVSVVVPIYNVQDYLRPCIDSIINQSYKNIEILLVNDGSTDLCHEICLEYFKKDLRIKYFKKKNGGLPSARNLGIKKATGDFICFIDSDDYIHKDFIKKLINFTIEQKTDLTTCGITRIEPGHSNQVTYPCDYRNNCVFDKNSIWRTFYLNRKLYDSGYSLILSTTKIYKKELFDKFKFKNIIHEDEYAANILFNKSKRIGVLSESLYFARKNRPGSIMTTTLKPENKSIRAFNVFCCFFERTRFFVRKKYPTDIIKLSLDGWIHNFFSLTKIQKLSKIIKVYILINKLYREKIIDKQTKDKFF